MADISAEKAKVPPHSQHSPILDNLQALQTIPKPYFTGKSGLPLVTTLSSETPHVPSDRAEPRTSQLW